MAIGQCLKSLLVGFEKNQEVIPRFVGAAMLFNLPLKCFKIACSMNKRR